MFGSCTCSGRQRCCCTSLSDFWSSPANWHCTLVSAIFSQAGKMLNKLVTPRTILALLNKSLNCCHLLIRIQRTRPRTCRVLANIHVWFTDTNVSLIFAIYSKLYIYIHQLITINNSNGKKGRLDESKIIDVTFNTQTRASFREEKSEEKKLRIIDQYIIFIFIPNRGRKEGVLLLQ